MGGDHMKLTPLDIQQWEFKVRVRGYDRQEVQAFLRSVSQAVEQLVKENTQLKERAEHLERQVNDLRTTEATLKDRKSTRLNSSHRCISYAVFCLKKKNKK